MTENVENLTYASAAGVAPSRAAPPTFGQKAVGLTFNPSGDPDVGMLKQHFADVIDNLDRLRRETPSQEAKRLASIAITEAQTAQMWAVKAWTWLD